MEQCRPSKTLAKVHFLAWIMVIQLLLFNYLKEKSKNKA